MDEPRLVLIEGMPGSGKSTMAQFILQRLTQNGEQPVWWYEEIKDHPIYVFNDAESLQTVVADLREGRYASVVAAALQQWQRFVEGAQSYKGTILVDGCLFGYLTWSLLPEDVPKVEVHAYLDAVADLIEPLNPHLIYFRQSDVELALRQVCARRDLDVEQAYAQGVGETPYGKRRGLQGVEGMVAYWSDYCALTDAAFSRLPMAKIEIEKSARDWTKYQRQVSDFLGLPTPQTSFASSLPDDHWTGYYRTVDGHASCLVGMENANLIVDGLQHTWPRTKLIRKSVNTFDVESLPFEISFEAVSSGGAKMTVTGPDLLWGRVEQTLFKNFDHQ